MIYFLLLLTSSVSSSTSPTSTSSLYLSLSPCSCPLGLESGELPNSLLRASSSYSRSVEARLGRLNTRVTRVISQGRWDRGLSQEWAEQLKIKYWSYGLWVGEGETRRVNMDTFTLVMVRLGEEDSLGIVMDRIRVFPVSDYPRTVCLRLELCGCELEEGQHQHTWQEVHDKVHYVQEELSGVRASQDIGREIDSLNPNLMSVVIGVLVTIILVLTCLQLFDVTIFKNAFETSNVDMGDVMGDFQGHWTLGSCLIINQPSPDISSLLSSLHY